ncbi:uncharacterized protein C10orf143 homolog [Pelobates fuscus]|uniref:uncharacterized protein C10orf143 homolog n=1 Tax=Pelobates fuscus TaxID=191477 RepID=UPI002FE46ACB
MRMEVCEDMTVDLPLANLRKRQCMGDMTEHPNSKRQCTSLGSIANGNGVLYNQFNDCDMVYWQMQMSMAKKEPVSEFVPQSENNMDYMPVENHGRSSSAQQCPRCIAGESGHINHILGL